jgi:hypothetical protein
MARAQERKTKRRLSHGDLLELKRWNTPTLSNGWEQITSCDSAQEGINCKECRRENKEAASRRV